LKIDEVENLDNFVLDNFGQRYYSIGVLQDNLIERWMFTNDRYDIDRLTLGNFFFTVGEAIEYRNYLLAYYNTKKEIRNV